MFAILGFIITIFLVVSVHEAGHYIAARCAGVRVLCFSVGFGRPLWQYKANNGTQWQVGLIPLGGYVKMLDERAGPVDEDVKHLAFNQASLLWRSIIVLAGPLSNFIFAFLIYVGIAMVGYVSVVPYVTEVTENSLSDINGLKVGDKIISVNNKPIETLRDWHFAIMDLSGSNNQEINLVISRDNNYKNISLITKWPSVQGQNFDANEHLGLNLGLKSLPPVIDKVMDNGPAIKSGLEPGDIITAINGQPIIFWSDAVNIIQNNPMTLLDIEIVRDSQPYNFSLMPYGREDDASVGFAGLQVVQSQQWKDLAFKRSHLGILQAFGDGLSKTYETTIFMIKGVGRLLTGRYGVETISGPVTVAQVAGEAVVLGLLPFFSFLALINISLGFINLLPIPMLDGGHLLYNLIEAIKGSSLSLKTQNLGFALGVVILLSLMALAFYNDLTRLFLGIT